jgi:hypothetical protein
LAPLSDATLPNAGFVVRLIVRRHRRVFSTAVAGRLLLGAAAIELTAIDQHASFFGNRNSYEGCLATLSDASLGDARLVLETRQRVL